MADGSVVDVWANSVEGLGGPEDRRDYLFGNLMDIAPAEQCAFDITATTPANPSRVIVTVARFPRSSVRHVVGAPDKIPRPGWRHESTPPGRMQVLRYGHSWYCRPACRRV